MKDLLKKLCAAFGPSGHEGVVRRLIEEELRPHVDGLRTDVMGNLYALKRGKSDAAIMLAAHMDQIGFIVTDADKKGFLRISPVGGIQRACALARRVVFSNGITGVIGWETEDVDYRDKSLGKLFVDIGAADREEALKRVMIGDMAVFAPDWAELGEDLVASPALDNRSGCALLVQTLKNLKDCPNNVVGVFTVQEEVGLRGARAASYDIAPTAGLALDVTATGDTPKGEKLPVKLGEGIAIKVMDKSLISSPGVVAGLEQAARSAGVRWQREVLSFGGTDAAEIQMTHSGVPVGVLSIPCRYVHSAAEVVSLRDMEEGLKLLAAVLGKAE